MAIKEQPLSPWREKIFEIIFEADTPSGKAFDVALLVAIIASVLAVILETVNAISVEYGRFLYILEWVFTVFFSIEYIMRIICVRSPMKYATSFFGIVDLLAILPTYLSLFIAGSHYLLVIRALRLMRVFRIFKLGRFLNEGSLIMAALKASRAKITVFLLFIVLMTVIIGSVMYLVEGNQESGFTSIPRSIYWAIVTMTTVGYGDIAPITPLGQFFAAFVMIMGYGVIAVPTGIVTAEMTNMGKGYKEHTNRACPNCGHEGHDRNALYCKHCGEEL